MTICGGVDHSVDAAARIWMKDPGALYLYGGQEQVERRLADKITILSSTNDNLTLDLDANTHLPVRRSFEWRDPLYKDKNLEGEEYDDYHKFNGISTPFSIDALSQRRHDESALSVQRHVWRSDSGRRCST